MPDLPTNTASEGIKATVPRRRIPLEGFVACTGQELMPWRAMFGELVEGKGYSLGQDEGTMVRLEEE